MKGAIMAKKHLELENVTVFYDFKDDSIKLTCKDPILEGKRFNLTLNQGSETEETLRKVLINEGFIERKREPIPEKKLIDDEFGRGILIGSSFDNDIYWNPIVDNLLSVGYFQLRARLIYIFTGVRLWIIFILHC